MVLPCKQKGQTKRNKKVCIIEQQQFSMMTTKDVPKIKTKFLFLKNILCKAILLSYISKWKYGYILNDWVNEWVTEWVTWRCSTTIAIRYYIRNEWNESECWTTESISGPTTLFTTQTLSGLYKFRLLDKFLISLM